MDIMTRKVETNTHSVLILIVSLALISCDQDPFNLQYRELSNGIYLQRWEDGTTYYLQTKNTIKSNGTGFLDGTVINIGWNNRYIVVEKQPAFHGDPSGWYLITSSTRNIEGPILKIPLDEFLKTNKIKVFSAKAAWDKLG